MGIGHLFEYEMNYIYVFSNQSNIDHIGLIDDDYRIMGFFKDHSQKTLSSVLKKLKYDYCHRFKCKETIGIKTNMENGNLDIQVDFFAFQHSCDYISFIIKK